MGSTDAALLSDLHDSDAAVVLSAVDFSAPVQVIFGVDNCYLAVSLVVVVE